MNFFICEWRVLPPKEGKRLIKNSTLRSNLIEIRSTAFFTKNNIKKVENIFGILRKTNILFKFFYKITFAVDTSEGYHYYLKQLIFFKFFSNFLNNQIENDKFSPFSLIFSFQEPVFQNKVL